MDAQDFQPVARQRQRHADEDGVPRMGGAGGVLLEQRAGCELRGGFGRHVEHRLQPEGRGIGVRYASDRTWLGQSPQRRQHVQRRRLRERTGSRLGCDDPPRRRRNRTLERSRVLPGRLFGHVHQHGAACVHGFYEVHRRHECLLRREGGRSADCHRRQPGRPPDDRQVREDRGGAARVQLA